MARLSETRAGSRNALAFLDMLAWAEGTSTSPATAMDGYDVIVTGIDNKPEVFKDFTDHPFAWGRKSKVINSKDLTSNASGRYQQMLRDWPNYMAAGHYRPLLDTANPDLANAKTAHDNPKALAGEQGRKLGELVAAGELRKREAALAQAQAKEEAQPDYAAANRLEIRSRPRHRSLIRSLGYEVAADGVGGVAGRVLDPGARGAYCAGGGASASAVQDAGGGCAALGSGQPEEGRLAGAEGAGAAGGAPAANRLRARVGSGGWCVSVMRHQHNWGLD